MPQMVRQYKMGTSDADAMDLTVTTTHCVFALVRICCLSDYVLPEG